MRQETELAVAPRETIERWTDQPATVQTDPDWRLPDERRVD